MRGSTGTTTSYICRSWAGILLSIASVSVNAAPLFAQSRPAQTMSASVPATFAAATAAAAPATAAVKKPTFDELLAGKTAPFDFEDTPVNAVIDALGKNYGIEIEHNYQKNDAGKNVPVIVDIIAAKPDNPLPVPRITIKMPGSISAHDAVDVVNATIMPFGFAVIGSVRLRDDAAHTPYGVLTIVATRKDAGAPPVYYGMDADKIPEGDQLRTQVITLKNLDISKAHDIVTSVLAKNADIVVNADRKMLIITDTDTHIHSAVTVLQILENQAAPGK
jgi:type II secretory pathway component GspD/PulD (secretin)